MATVCCFCGQKLGKIMDTGYEVEGSSSGARMCWPCKQKKDALSGTEEEKRAEAVAFFEGCLKNVKLEPDVRELTQQWLTRGEEKYQKKKHQEEVKEKYDADIESFLMTTTNHLEGYSVQAYQGIASSEVVMGQVRCLNSWLGPQTSLARRTVRSVRNCSRPGTRRRKKWRYERIISKRTRSLA